MESPKPTTPLCRRTLPLAHVATQIPAATWRNVLRAIRTARPALSVSERPLASATLTRPSPKNTCSSSSRTTVSQNRRHGGPDPATPTRALRGRLRYRQPTASAAHNRAGEGRACARRVSLSARGHRRAEEPQHTFANKRRPRPTGKAKVANTNSMPTHPDPIVGGKPVERRHKFFSTPYLFAQCGAYSGGRPNGQEEDDRPAAQPLANRRRSSAPSPRSITQLE